jgi:hypothetical protein
LRDLLGDDPAPVTRAQRGSVRVTLPPYGAWLLAPADDTIPGYSFFKRR